MIKKHFYFLLIISIISVAFIDKPFLPTSLKITVVDMDNNPVEGVAITLFGNEKDYRAETNKISTTQKTNAKGHVVFRKMKPRQYYIHATKGESSNIGESILTNKLLEGRINKVTTVLD